MTLSEATKILSDSGIDSPLHDARELFRLYCPEPVLLNTECSDPALISAIERRAGREPLQYIIGRVGFYREEYIVSPACLIPRPDTELLVDFAVKNLPRGENFLDICTGSGCIAISVLKNTLDTRAKAVDISPEALDLARKNAELNEVGDRIEFERHDALNSEIPGEFFALLSNPPYVSTEAYANLADEIYREPSIAFLGGEDGGDFYRRLTEIYKGKIKEGGFIAYEIGYDQGELLRSIAEKNSMDCKIIKDLGQNDRLAVLTKKF